MGLLAEIPRTPEEILGSKQLAALMLGRLNERELAVIQCRVFEGKTLTETAHTTSNAYGTGTVLPERVRQIQAKALRKMHFAVRSHDRTLADIEDDGRRTRAEALRKLEESAERHRKLVEIARRDRECEWTPQPRPRPTWYEQNEPLHALEGVGADEALDKVTESELRRAAAAHEYAWLPRMVRALDEEPLARAAVLAAFRKKYR